MPITLNAVQINAKTGWDDLQFPATQTRQGQNLLPAYDETECGFTFAANAPNSKLYMNGQMPHAWKKGSTIYPHIHFIQVDATIPTFKIDYRIYNLGDQKPVSFTTLTINTAVFPYTAGNLNQIVKSAAPIAMSAYTSKPSVIMDIKLYRDDVAGGTSVVFKGFDFHYEIDSLGSDQEFEKSF